MKNLSIRQRLFILVIVPLLALAVTAANLIGNAYHSYRSAQLTEQALQAGVAAGELIHTLQIERGATAGFLQSKGAKFADALPGIRKNTDDRLAAYQQLVAGAGRSDLLAGALAKAGESLGQLGDVRARADKQAISVADEVAAYTRAISGLIDLIGASRKFSSSPQVVQQTTAYLALVRAKEQAGQERALVTAVFAANSIDPERYRKILERVYRQEAYLDIFRSTASDAARQSLQEVLSAPPAREVQRLLGVLMDKSASGGFDVEPTQWFATITQMIDGLHQTENLLANDISVTAAGVVTASERAFYGYIALVGVAVALVVWASLWISASVAKPLHAEVDVAEFAVRESDFTHNVPESGPSEVVRAGHAFNQLMHTFRQIVSDMKAYSDQVTMAAHALAAASREVQGSSQSQSDAASSVAAAVEEASVSISETNANARNAAAMVEASRADTVEAKRVMDEDMTNMKEIAKLIRDSSERITALNQSSQQIGGIVQVIQEIAEQTNLLALNAAIEAARAGELGRGFSVVADEVHHLAERTARATDQISGLIGSIQADVAGTVDAMAMANRKADSSLERVGATESVLDRIDDNSVSVSDKVLAIAGALQQQDAAIRQIAQSIEQIAQMTERNAHAAEDNNATAGELDALASELRRNVSRFKA